MLRGYKLGDLENNACTTVTSLMFIYLIRPKLLEPVHTTLYYIENILFQDWQWHSLSVHISIRYQLFFDKSVNKKKYIWLFILYNVQC